MNEFNLISHITAGFKTYHGQVVKGIGDDCAVWKENDTLRLFTTDTMVEGDHFIKEWFTPQQIGIRFIESNVSDIAAMGGTPTFLFVSLVLDSKTSPDWTRKLYLGIKSVCNHYKISLLGGNITHGRTVSLTASLFGEAKSSVIYRSTAKTGDLVVVTGDIGSACVARLLLNKKITPPHYLFNRFSHPKARVDEAQIIRKFASSMIDISDGIASEAKHLAKDSKRGVIIDTTRIPVIAKARKYEGLIGQTLENCALRGGEDYELMFTVSKKNWPELQSEFTFNTPLTVVGEICSKKEYLQVNSDKTITPLVKGFDHFSENINL